MNISNESMENYEMIKQYRMMMYSSPKRYYNREGKDGSAFRFLFLVEIVVFLLLVAATGGAMAQTKENGQMAMAAIEQQELNIHSYQAIYNTGKVFVSWTSKNEQEDCIYIV